MIRLINISYKFKNNGKSCCKLTLFEDVVCKRMGFLIVPYLAAYPGVDSTQSLYVFTTQNAPFSLQFSQDGRHEIFCGKLKNQEKNGKGVHQNILKAALLRKTI